MISGRQEIEVAVVYLLGAILLFLWTLLVIGVVLIRHARTESHVMTGKGWLVQHQAFLMQLGNIVRSHSTHHGTLLFISLGMVCVISVLVLTLAGVCACVASTRNADYLLTGLLVLTVIAGSFLRH